MKTLHLLLLAAAGAGGIYVIRSRKGRDRIVFAELQQRLALAAKQVAAGIGLKGVVDRVPFIVNAFIAVVGNQTEAIRKYAPEYLAMLARLGVGPDTLAKAKAQLGTSTSSSLGTLGCPHGNGSLG